MKHQNITFSIPEYLKANLQLHVGKGGMSRFISCAILKALQEDELKKEQDLDAAYEAASQDSSRLETLQNWNVLDDVSDLNNEDEDWKWLKSPLKKN